MEKEVAAELLRNAGVRDNPGIISAEIKDGAVFIHTLYKNYKITLTKEAWHITHPKFGNNLKWKSKNPDIGKLKGAYATLIDSKTFYRSREQFLKAWFNSKIKQERLLFTLGTNKDIETGKLFQSVAYFIDQVETRLKIKKTVFNPIDVPGVIRMRISPFWTQRRFRISLFTILLRVGLSYSVRYDNFEECLSMSYLRDTRQAFERFLDGYTDFAHDDLVNAVHGWYYVFSRPAAWRLLTKDYYKVLDVKRTISTEELTKRYKQLRRRHHPDLNKSPGAIQRFKEVGEAYDEIMKERNASHH